MFAVLLLLCDCAAPLEERINLWCTVSSVPENMSLEGGGAREGIMMEMKGVARQWQGSGGP